MTWLAARTVGVAPPNCFESEYGVAGDGNSPSQANNIWARWFPGPQRYYGIDDVREQAWEAMRQTIGSVERTMRGPFVNKSIGHSERIGPLFHAFPNAIIVRIRRDHQQVAESILCGRREYFGDEREWFSVRPRDYDRIRSLDPIRQICEQVCAIERDIETDTKLFAGSRVYQVSYEDFCRSPNETLQDFSRCYEDMTNTQLTVRGAIPSGFTASTRRKVSDDEGEQIRAELQRIAATDTTRVANV